MYFQLFESPANYCPKSGNNIIFEWICMNQNFFPKLYLEKQMAFAIEDSLEPKIFLLYLPIFVVKETNAQIFKCFCLVD